MVIQLVLGCSSILKENRIANWEDFRGSITNFDSLADQKYPNVEEGRQMIIDDYRRIIDEIDNEMHRYFSPACRPTAKCNVERIPPFKEATAPAAYYFPPSLDGKSAGTFFANLRDINEVVKFKMASLAYHEAVPGHHFQVRSLLDDRFSPPCISVYYCSIVETFTILSTVDSFYCLHGRLGALHRTISR